MLHFVNRSAERAAVFHDCDVNALDEVPARYTVGASGKLTHPLPRSDQKIDIFVIRPNGFQRRLTGKGDVFSATIDTAIVGRPSLLLEYPTAMHQTVAMADKADGASLAVIRLASREARGIPLDLAKSHGWYDWQFEAEAKSGVWRAMARLERNHIRSRRGWPRPGPPGFVSPARPV